MVTVENFSNLDSIKQKNSPFSSAFFIFLFEMCFVIVMLSTFLIAVNYFNILPVGKIFPFLSFLPKLKNTQVQNNLSLSKITPTPVDTLTDTPEHFVKYNDAKASKEITDYIKANVQPVFIPKNIVVKHNLSSDNKQTDTDYTYGSYWQTQGATFYAVYHYNTFSMQEKDLSIFITLPEQPSTQDLKKVAGMYLTQLLSPSPACQNVINATNTSSICESFTTDFSSIKHGMGLTFITINAPTPAGKSQKINLLHICRIPPKSDTYTWNSCIQKFSDKGVGK